MTWLLVVLGGHLANAGAFIIDKILLAKRVPHPAVYAFYIGLLNMLVLIWLPFADFNIPPLYTLTQSALSGSFFVVALICFFTALKHGETSRVVPVVGGLIPIFTFGFAKFFLGEDLIGWQWWGILLLIGGAIFISYEEPVNGTPWRRTEVISSILAALFFAFSTTLTKAVFRDTEFFNGLIWTRIFAFLTSVSLLAIPFVRAAVLGRGQEDSERPSRLFFIGQTMGGLGFFLLAVALKLAPQVTIVNALQGVQYAFLFLLVIFFSRFAPNILREELSRRQIIRKTWALLCLAVGLILVA